MIPLKTILYPTDFSPRSDEAFQIACQLVREPGARIIVLHVLDMPATAYSGVAMAPPPPPPSEEERKQLLDRLRQIQAPGTAAAVDHRLEIGDPATAILQVAKEVGANLIVMGTHGRTGLGRLLMGSVAEKVVRGATCPVVTVKTP